MINCMGTSKQLGVSLKRKNQGNSHTLQKFRRACKMSHEFRMRCENFAHPANKFHTLCENKTPYKLISHTLRNFCRACEKFRTPNTILHAVQKPKGSANPFCTPNVISHAMRKSKDVVQKWKVTLPFLFKPLSPNIPILQAPLSLWIPHFSLPPCDLIPLHLTPCPAHVISKTRNLSPLRVRTQDPLSISDMALTRGALPTPSPSRTPRQRVSSAWVPHDSSSQATEASQIPPSKGGAGTSPSSPTPQRRYETMRPPTTPGMTTLRPCAYLSDTDHHTCCSLPTDGWDACPSGPADCYTSPDSTTPGTSTSTSAWPSYIIKAFSSNWGYYSSWGHYHSRGPDPATLGGHHRCHYFNWSSGWASDSCHSDSFPIGVPADSCPLNGPGNGTTFDFVPS